MALALIIESEPQPIGLLIMPTLNGETSGGQKNAVD
jgi:hypothetical protein